MPETPIDAPAPTLAEDETASGAENEAEPVDAAAAIDADLEALARIESELADVEVVLACLESGSDSRCEVCVAAERDGSLAARPALELCSAGREPAG